MTDGGAGCLELADTVIEACRNTRETEAPDVKALYSPDDNLRTKIGKVAAMYGADGVDYTPEASRLLDTYEKNDFGDLKVTGLVSLVASGVFARLLPPLRLSLVGVLLYR